MFSTMENNVVSTCLPFDSSEFIEKVAMLPNIDTVPVKGKQQTAPEKKNSKGKRFRTVFTSYQLLELEREYSINIYLCRTRRLGIANRLGIDERKVKVWFQNRRMKSRKESKDSNLIHGANQTRPRASSNASSVDSKRSSPSVEDQRHSPEDHHNIVNRLMSYTQDAHYLATKSVKSEQKHSVDLNVTTSENLIPCQSVNSRIMTGPYFEGYSEPFYAPANYNPYLESSCQVQNYGSSPEYSQFDCNGYRFDGVQDGYFAGVPINNTDTSMNQFWESYTDFINL